MTREPTGYGNDRITARDVSNYSSSLTTRIEGRTCREGARTDVICDRYKKNL
jgi:hypothetical protein